MPSNSIEHITGFTEEVASNFSLGGTKNNRLMYKDEVMSSPIIKISGTLIFAMAKSATFPKTKPKLQLEVDDNTWYAFNDLQEEIYGAEFLAVRNEKNNGFSSIANFESEDGEYNTPKHLKIAVAQEKPMKSKIKVYLMGAKESEPIFDLTKLTRGTVVDIYLKVEGVNEFQGTKSLNLTAERINVTGVYSREDLSEQCQF